MSTQPKETYGLNLVPARAHVAQRPCPGCLAHACKAKRTYDGGLVDESEEPARRRQARALIGARLARGRGCVEAASSPRLLLAEHRGPSGAQEGGRADEEQQHDEEGVEVEQRRLRPRQAASAPRWVGWSGVLLRGAHHAAGCLARWRASSASLRERWRSGRSALFNTKTASFRCQVARCVGSFSARKMPSTEIPSEDAALLRLQRYARRRHQRLRARRIDLAVVASPYGKQRLLLPSKPAKNLLRRNERACLIIQSHARARAAWRAAGGGAIEGSADIADEAASFWRQWLSTAGAEPSGNGWNGNGLPDDPQETLQLQLPLSLPHGGAGLTAAALDACTYAIRDELCALLALRREQLHVSCPSEAAKGGTGGGSGATTLVQLELSAANDHPSVGPSQAALTLANLVGGDLNRFQPTSMPPRMVGAGRRLAPSEVRRDRAAPPRHAATLPHAATLVTMHAHSHPASPNLDAGSRRGAPQQVWRQPERVAPRVHRVVAPC